MAIINKNECEFQTDLGDWAYLAKESVLPVHLFVAYANDVLIVLLQVVLFLVLETMLFPHDL